jgi:hypothetical protein
MKKFQDSYISSNKHIPIILFDIIANKITDWEKDDIIALIKNDYDEDIKEMVEKGINLNSIVVVSVDLNTRTTLVDIINKPYNNE